MRVHQADVWLSMPRLSLCLLVVALLPFASALLEEKFVGFTATNGSVPLRNANIIYDPRDPAGVRIAVEALATDFEQITGRRLSNSTWNGNGTAIRRRNCTASVAVIVGTVDSQLVRTLVNSRKVDISNITGKWETFRTSVVVDPLPGVRKALVIVGSDMRGTAFGVYTLAEQAGQSPYHFWADVPATKHEEVYALAKTTTHGEPTVKFRGLFINDEAPALTGWWSRYNNKEHQKLDSNFYRHVFDMMVRLKANFIWPGSWKAFVPEPGNIFFSDDPLNMDLANDYGIVVSTSHHEPMQRATNEWFAHEKEWGSWDWVKNRDNVTRFMEDGVKRAGGNDSYFTLGMRSDADGPIQGDDPIGILRDVFKTEREMLAREYGNETAAKQVWTIYKEVMIYYAAGLIPPDDVTLMFTDDNWGNNQRLPLANETARSGGVGLYYHLQYTGGPKAYKWANTNNLPKVYKELFHALERGATQIWVINVADIKPLEMPFNMVMDLAWDRSVLDFDRIPTWVEAFTAREFGAGNHSKEIASILLEYSRLIGRRKYETTQEDTYSYRNFWENERVAAEWASLSERALALRDQIAPELRETFFHYIEYPVHAGYLYISVKLGIGLNNAWGRERRNVANALAAKVLEDFDADFDMVLAYDALHGGKWGGIAAQPKHDQYGVPSSIGDEWWEPTTDAVAPGLWYVQLRQNATSTFGNLGVFVEGSISAQMQGRSLPSAARGSPTSGRESPVLPILTPYNAQQTRYLDIYHRGDYRVPIQWTLKPPQPWVKLNQTSGIIDAATQQQRVELTIDWDAVPVDFDQKLQMRFEFDCIPYFDIIHLPVFNMRAPQGFVGFPFDGKFLSIEAPHYTRVSSGVIAYEHIPLLGTRSNSGSIALRPYKAAREDAGAAAREAWAEYDVFVFGNGGILNATVYINQGLDTDPTLMMEWSLTLDGALGRNVTGGGAGGAGQFRDSGNATVEWARVLGDPAKAGDTPPGWYGTVADHVWVRRTSFGQVPGGKHTLRWRTNSPEVYLEKIVLSLNDSVPTSYLGPPETVRLG